MSIYDAYLTCKASFLSCRENPHLPVRSLLDNELGRFEAWAANTGASRDGSSSVSLDSRLRDSQKTQQMVHMLLRVLGLNLDYGEISISTGLMRTISLIRVQQQTYSMSQKKLF
jgi:hypothetical protein